MGTELSDPQLWDFVAAAPTGILSTLRRDGWPVALPVWFVAIERTVYIPSFAALAKVGRIERDQRAGFVVESGLNWTELRGVSLSVTADVLRTGADVERARAALDEKYPPGVAAPFDRMPRAVQAFYGGDAVIIRLRLAREPISWDNSKLRLRDPQPAADSSG